MSESLYGKDTFPRAGFNACEYGFLRDVSLMREWDRLSYACVSCFLTFGFAR